VGSKSTAALMAGVRTGCLDVVMVAGRYTLVEQPALDELFPLCQENRVDVIAAGVFNSGLLAAPAPGPHAKYEYADVPPDVLSRARRLEAVCAEYGVALPVAALQFVLRAPPVRCVVVGGAEPRHVRENVERVGTPVPEELWERLAAEGLVRT
jgi:D-threo-aldose 1-dehydrogenase